ncbi:MAG TPA: tetratricopeptide repeat protein [Planctomycetota bacterium]|nr:tetratricopeptide repeat protein [Planctomycetota bacterium]
MTADALYQKATDAVERQNYDYAIELLYQLISQEPANVKARQTLWLAEKRKYGEGGPAKVSAFFKGLGPRLSAAVHSLTGKPLKLMADCERYLMVNPGNAVMRNKLAQAAYEAGDIETSIAAYESAREVDPKNINALRQLGRLYKERFDADHGRDHLNLAMNRFEELLKIRPTDHEAKNAAQALAAQRAIDDGGWQTAEGARELIRDEETQADLERDERLVRTEDDVDREIASLTDAIEAEPERSNLYVRQGDLLLQKKRFKSAEECFKKAHELEPLNTFTRARLGEVKIQYMKARLDQLAETLTETPDDATRKQHDELAAQLDTFMVREYHQRVADQPTNMEVHHRLGHLLFNRGEYDGAMQMFQKSVADPRYRMSANHMLGKCLVEKGMYDRAINLFKRAVEGAVVMNHMVKGVYYDLGDTYVKMQNWEQAEQAFGRIYDADVGFRDISQKMDYVYKKARGQDA